MTVVVPDTLIPGGAFPAVRSQDVEGLTDALAGKASLASPVLTGTPRAPTPTIDVSTDQIATAAFVKAVVAALVNASPSQLDTLNELAAALGNDANFAATITAALAGKATAAQGAKADSALQPGTAQSNVAGFSVDADGFSLTTALGWGIARFFLDGGLKTSAFGLTAEGLQARDFSVRYGDGPEARHTRSPLGWSIERLGADGSLKTTAFEIAADRVVTGGFRIVATDKPGISVTTPLGWSIGLNATNVSGLTSTTIDSPSEGTLTTPLGWKAGLPAAVPFADMARRAPAANSVVWFWHSKGDQDSYAGHKNGDVVKRSDLGTNAWADYYLRGSTEPLFNASVGGESSSGLIARIATDVIARKPAWCFFGVPACNDINAGRSAPTIIENCRAIVDALQNAGIKVLIHTDPTWYTGHADLTPANVAKLHTVNRWVRALPLTRGGVVAADVAKAFADPLSATGAAKPLFLKTDNIHPVPKGARAGGKVKADALIAAGFPILDLLPRSATDTAAFDSGNKQLAANPLMTSTGGTNSAGTTFTGAVPAGWIIAKAGTWGVGLVTGAMELRADGLGYDWVVTISGCGAAGDYLTLAGPDCLPYVVEGDRIEAAAEISLTGMSKVNEHSLFVFAGTNEAGALKRDDQVNSGAGWGSDYYDQSDLTGGVFRTGTAVVSAAPGLCRAYFRIRFDAASGTATIRIGRFCVNKRN